MAHTYHFEMYEEEKVKKSFVKRFYILELALPISFKFSINDSTPCTKSKVKETYCSEIIGEHDNGD